MNLGVPRILDPVSRDAILASLRAGEKIKAVKYYRLATGAGLSEAMRAVDNIRIQNNIPSNRAAVGEGFPVVRIALIGIVVLLGLAFFLRYTH